MNFSAMAGGGGHAVVRVNVVLDENRDSMQGATRFPRLTFFIERICNLQCIGI